MIKMYVMHTCPDCEYVEKQVVGNPNFEVIDIGQMILESPVMYWKMEPSRSILRMLDWSQGHRRRVRLAVSTEEGAEQIRHQKPRSRAVETKRSLIGLTTRT